MTERLELLLEVLLLRDVGFDVAQQEELVKRNNAFIRRFKWAFAQR